MNRWRVGVTLALLAACESRSGNPLNNTGWDVPLATSDAAVIDAPATDLPARDVPTLDAPVTDAPTMDAPVTDAPVIDAPTSDAPVGDRAVVDVAVSDGGVVRCPTTFRYEVPAGRTVTRVEVTGEWSGWVNPGAPLRRAGNAFVGDVPLPVGTHGYKLLVDGEWTLDPAARRRRYVDGVENSGVRVPDCRLPTLSLVRGAVTRSAPGQGRYQGSLRVTPGVTSSAVGTVSLTLVRDGVERALPAATVGSDGTVPLDLTALADGKYTLLARATDANGREAEPLRVIFWVEAEVFEWRDTLLYLAMPDRFANGDRANDPARAPNVDPRADYQGGDLQGLRARIADGTLDRLGVRVLWMTPVNVNPGGSFLAQDGIHQVTGYHGYWPISPRAVDPRLGGEAALDALVREAHAHGIRVLLDFVVNHVHRDHAYARETPSWFRTGCVCGTSSCDWTARRLDCLFTPYLPDVNWSVNDAADRFAEDAAWWLQRFDVDGFRVDAVKHVEDIAAVNLRATLHERFEASGQRVFLTGETAMGWNDCGLDCNRSEYDTISRYIAPNALDGQKDFVLYHAVPYRAFATDDRGMLHVDYWTRQSALQYPAGSVMTPYIGSHDTARFVTLASYRGQSPQWDRGVPGRQWDDVAGPPGDGEAYARHRLALSWLLTIPGAPLIYMGDEYGEWGGADPNNRRFWRGDATDLSTEERLTLTHTRALGSARRELVALRRGVYESLSATEDTLVYARRHEGAVAVVALNRAGVERVAETRLPTGFPWIEGTTLRDRLGGATVRVTSGALNLRLPPRSSMVLAP